MKWSGDIGFTLGYTTLEGSFVIDSTNFQLITSFMSPLIASMECGAFKLRGTLRKLLKGEMSNSSKTHHYQILSIYTQITSYLKGFQAFQVRNPLVCIEERFGTCVKGSYLFCPYSRVSPCPIVAPACNRSVTSQIPQYIQHSNSCTARVPVSLSDTSCINYFKSFALNTFNSNSLH